MAFDSTTKQKIMEYCQSHLPKDDWYKNAFDFIKDVDLKNRIIEEFKAIRFAYKLYEGLSVKNEYLLFEIRYQIIAYATIFEAITSYVLKEYYSDTIVYDELTHQNTTVQAPIPPEKKAIIQNALSHDGEEVHPYFIRRKRKEDSSIRFDDKCKALEDLKLIDKCYDNNGKAFSLRADITDIYSYRNAIHLEAEKRKGIHYELELSKKAYRRLKPFLESIKNGLIRDGKI